MRNSQDSLLLEINIYEPIIRRYVRNERTLVGEELIVYSSRMSLILLWENGKEKHIKSGDFHVASMAMLKLGNIRYVTASSRLPGG